MINVRIWVSLLALSSVLGCGTRYGHDVPADPISEVQPLPPAPPPATQLNSPANGVGIRP